MNISDTVEIDNDRLIFQCPHCGGFIIVLKNELNCKIFRHGVFKENGNNINPHASESECNTLFNSEKIFGCAKPFRIIVFGENYKIQKCGYI